MGHVGTEGIIVLLLILLNGVFSMSELAIVSARKNRLQMRADEGSRGARTALDLAETPNRFLSTVQIGITLIGILSGAFGGATVAEEISTWLAQFPRIAPYRDGISVAVVVVVITYLSLVFGELVPKRLAMNSAESIAEKMARPMYWLSLVAAPLVALLSKSTEAVLHFLHVHPSEDLAVTEEDVQSMISQGAQIGVFDESEQEMVTQVFRLGDRRISMVMTPRMEITFLDVHDSSEEQARVILEAGYSRFPVYSESIDNILGIVLVKDIFYQKVRGEEWNLQALIRPALFLPERMIALEALEQMKQAGCEMALIMDEYGGLMGLVCMADILETIVGDTEISQPGEDSEIVRREDGSYLVGGMLLLDELKDVLDVDAFPDEEKGYFETLGGMLMTQLGRIPEVGDVYEWNDVRFEIVDMDGRRVDKVLITPAAVQSGQAFTEQKPTRPTSPS